MAITKTTMLIGGLLIVLGLVFYITWQAVTALIPAYFGLPVLLFGVVAALGNDRVRMHSMHAAVVITSLGTIGALVRGLMGLAKVISGADNALPPAVTGQLLMAALCLLHVVLSVRSFIAARRG